MAPCKRRSGRSIGLTYFRRLRGSNRSSCLTDASRGHGLSRRVAMIDRRKGREKLDGAPLLGTVN